MLDAWRRTAGRYALLPLRIFLGVTFVYAGLDKLTSDTFFSGDPGANGSLLQTLHSVHDQAAVPGLIDLALKAPQGFGYAIAIGEAAVGLGVLAGLLGRVAAAGGALISLSLWLTVSWSATPYYFGNDLAYLMAWLPLVLAGTPYLSLDGLAGRRRGGLLRRGTGTGADAGTSAAAGTAAGADSGTDGGTDGGPDGGPEGGPGGGPEGGPGVGAYRGSDGGSDGRPGAGRDGRGGASRADGRVSGHRRGAGASARPEGPARSERPA